MTTGWLGFEGKTENRRDHAAPAPDNTVSPARAWLIRVALVGSCAALLGTSQNVPPGYHYLKEEPLPKVTLDDEHTRAGFIITVRATDLNPEGLSTTVDAMARVEGRATVADAAAGGSLITATLADSDGATAGEEQEIEGSFTLARPLRFTGDCDAPQSGVPCQAELALEVAAKDAATLGAASVTWSLVLTGSSPKPGGDDEFDVEPPWEVTIEAQ